ncbi:hypothetical protein [Streptomyces sp. NPDC093093]|uniref:hypothetical protein n=1 Tax=Streptomyces sp. NPDC093093 TaxID=3366025 RepID=UPI0038214028
MAEKVIQAFQRAGVYAFREDRESSDFVQSGAVIYIHPDAELGSAALSVGWRCSDGMIQAAMDALSSGAADVPAVRYPGMIGLHMQSSLIKILLSSGIIATPECDTMNPEHVLVFGMQSDLPPALRPNHIS